MEWLIIVFIMLFVIAPVMWLKPSPRQKRQQALRTQIAKQGVSIKLEKPPLHHGGGSRKPRSDSRPTYLNFSNCGRRCVVVPTSLSASR